ncbi:maleylpyruvate isomerase family mycothiol-dependent enzyme [Actinomadura rudentiformis]|uniref:Maleylpyruvate isomerase family mycothiol-dependent enzyme n=1 Tax=Actinomadura rudentiformis TaxID=359158 RepID=A0A6H9YHU9_9ACTN|nr:maleylpyruvate isomerase family mycothiol-dependent enzyme [Actinomadura rudentiformis]KAB2343640.1 maleylpyruvate isomerase family mycothiol-dependent enzyme [Actinomadura rudentiformis]
MRAPDVRRLAEGLRLQTAGLAGTVTGTHPGTWIPTCPEWSLRDLVEHVGQAQRWAAALVEQRATEPLPLEPVVSLDAGDWPEWLLAGAEWLIAATEECDVEVWTFLGPRPATFWLRRMLHDTSVHHADAALALDRPYELAPDLAADAICEGLDMISGPLAETLNPGFTALRGDGEALALQPAEPDVDGWLITRTPGGVTWKRGNGAANVVVSAGVTDLLLVITRRLPPDDLRTEVIGERPLLDHWLEHTAFEGAS